MVHTGQVIIKVPLKANLGPRSEVLRNELNTGRDCALKDSIQMEDDLWCCEDETV